MDQRCREILEKRLYLVRSSCYIVNIHAGRANKDMREQLAKDSPLLTRSQSQQQIRTVYIHMNVHGTPQMNLADRASTQLRYPIKFRALTEVQSNIRTRRRRSITAASMQMHRNIILAFRNGRCIGQVHLRHTIDLQYPFVEISFLRHAYSKSLQTILRTQRTPQSTTTK